MTTSGATRGPVAVVGATGRQGTAVVRHLLRAGRGARALTRTPDSPAARALAAAGAEVVRVDAEDAASLEQAFTGATGVFTVQNPMTGGVEAEIRQGRNVAAAAARTGVPHVVYGAAGVVDHPTGVGSWDSKLVIAERFAELDVPVTVLRPMAFMELMTDPAFYPRVSVWHVMPKLMGADRPVGWVCTDDVGAIAVTVLADPERYAGRVLPLVADVQSIDQCRALWREVAGRAPSGVPMPTWLFERFVGDDLTTMWRWLGAHDLDLSSPVTRELRPGALTVREWLAVRLSGRR